MSVEKWDEESSGQETSSSLPSSMEEEDGGGEECPRGSSEGGDGGGGEDELLEEDESADSPSKGMKSHFVVSYPVKLQVCPAEQSDSWTIVGTGSLLLTVENDERGVVIVLASMSCPSAEETSADDDQEDNSQIYQVIHSVSVKDVQLNCARDGVVYLRQPDQFLAYAFKDAALADQFYSCLAGGDFVSSSPNDSPDNNTTTTDADIENSSFFTGSDSLDFLTIYTPTLTNVTDFLSHIKSIEDSVTLLAVQSASLPPRLRTSNSPMTTAKSFVNAVMKRSWLDSFWNLLHTATQANDQNVLLTMSEFIIRLINLGCRLRATQLICTPQMQPLLSWHYDINAFTDNELLSVASKPADHASPSPLLDSQKVDGQSTADREENQGIAGPKLLLQSDFITEDWESLRMRADQLGLPRQLSSFLDPLCILLANRNFENCLQTLERLPVPLCLHLVVPHLDFWRKQMCISGEEVLAACLSSPDDQKLFGVTMSWLARLSYMRDVCLPRVCEDATIARISVLISSCNLFLCKILRNDRNCIPKLQQALPSSTKVCLFVLQMLRGMKTSALNVPERGGLFQALVGPQTLIALEGYFTGKNEAVRNWKSTHRHLEALRKAERKSTFALFDTTNRYEGLHPIVLATEIFHICSLACPRHIHQAFLQSSEANAARAPTLWLALTRVLQLSNSHAALVQVTEIYRNFLKPEVFANDMEQADILEIFFDKGVFDLLIEMLMDNTNGTQEPRLFAKAQILNILCHCSRLKQSGRMNYRFVNCNLLHRLVTMTLSLYSKAKKKAMGQGIKNLLLHTIKFVKTFAAEQEPNVRYGTPQDPVSSLLHLLCPTDVSALAEQAAQSTEESNDEDESLQSNESSHGVEFYTGNSSDDTSVELATCRRNKGLKIHNVNRKSLPRQEASIFERRKHEGSIIEAALLELLQTIIRTHEDKKLLIRNLVEKNLGVFTLLETLYKRDCGIDLFTTFLDKAQVDIPSSILLGGPAAPYKHATKSREPSSAKSLPSQSGMGMLKRRNRASSLSSSTSSSSFSSSPQSKSSDDLISQTPPKKPRTEGPTSLSHFPESPNQLSSAEIAGGHYAETAVGCAGKLPASVAKPQEEVEDALDSLLRGGANSSASSSPASTFLRKSLASRSASPSLSGGIRINFQKQD